MHQTVSVCLFGTVTSAIAHLKVNSYITSVTSCQFFLSYSKLDCEDTLVMSIFHFNQSIFKEQEPKSTIQLTHMYSLNDFVTYIELCLETMVKMMRNLKLKSHKDF